MTVRILIVDDHPVVRDGLRGMLASQPDFTVVGEAGGGAEALAWLAKPVAVTSADQPDGSSVDAPAVGPERASVGVSGRFAVPEPAASVDLVLTDLRMPPPAGAALIRLIRREYPTIRVLVLTTYDTDADIIPSMEAGAVGYLLKDTPREELFRAVRLAAIGQTVLSPPVADRLVNRLRTNGERPTLSGREREVIALVAAGNSNRDIAAALFISEATVKTHLVHIYTKLGVNDRAAAVAAGYDTGILGG
ncbi:DNA-binding NarL/FixJ family response regulator [Stackebrandtia endophytica]|uniref:DNA-binding NarL/FixJ family response regulator n=1 Tax=Stackebrandtia endophytica TaxID=1496996 RepID=A0A543B366_9ACTN|nr:response regulator transcription factor [Stackebrandtia endophytica]TQL79253.1 DNA-binding NarL/FixJ family response regulator [Stackebrandtia endophytica]